MTESRSENLMQMVPSYCGSLGHWSRERRRIERKRSSSLALRLGKPNFCFLNPPPTSLPTVGLFIFSENMFIGFLSISSPASFPHLFSNSFWASCWHSALPGGVGGRLKKQSQICWKDTGPRKVQLIQSQCQGLVQGGSHQRFRGMSRGQGQLSWAVWWYWECCFQEDQIPKQLTTADLPAISFTMPKLDFGNTILHLLPFNATLQFVSGKVDTQYSNHVHATHQIPSTRSKVHYTSILAVSPSSGVD